MPLNASPWDLFSDDNLSFIERREKAGEPILAADLDRILKANPASRADPLMQRYLALASEGKLKPRRGRPQRTTYQRIMLGFMVLWLPARAEEIRRKRAAAGEHDRAAEEPIVQAANEIGYDFGMRMYGRNLVNAVSAERTRMLI